jgi:hypothetical protein
MLYSTVLKRTQEDSLLSLRVVFEYIIYTVSLFLTLSAGEIPEQWEGATGGGGGSRGVGGGLRGS